MVKTAIIGASGYIGRHLWVAYNKNFPESLGTAFSTHNKGLQFFDIRQPNIASLRLEEQGYKAVIITAANPNIAFCEQNRDEAYAVNVRGTLELVRQLGKTSLQTIFLSSDYVFNGLRGSYEDGAPTAPTTEYGRQKAEVERTIPTLTDDFLILRIGKIYGVEDGDKTLLDEIANALACRQTIQCATDQIFCPTLIGDLTASIMYIQAKQYTGLLNLCSKETWSRYDIANLLAQEMHADQGLIKKISLYDIPAMIGRPLDTSMICTSSVVKDLQKGFTSLKKSIKRVADNY